MSFSDATKNGNKTKKSSHLEALLGLALLLVDDTQTEEDFIRLFKSWYERI